jgi:hypothetical protein
MRAVRALLGPGFLLLQFRLSIQMDRGVSKGEGVLPSAFTKYTIPSSNYQPDVSNTFPRFAD